MIGLVLVSRFLSFVLAKSLHLPSILGRILPISRGSVGVQTEDTEDTLIQRLIDESSIYLERDDTLI